MTKKPITVAILMPGDMGHGVGQALIAAGHRAITCLAGRSTHTRALAERAKIEDVPNLDSLCSDADLILSILPPDRAVAQAADIAAAMQRTGATPAYVDCNAISPETAQKVALTFSGLGTKVIDCGIIGLNPIKSPPTRFYVSGPDTDIIEALQSEAITVTKIGDRIGAASALKMVYAAGTKGVWTLQTALLMAAKQLGVLDPLLSELDYSQSAQLKAMRSRIPFLPADSARWVPEMQEIAATFASAGVTPGFHDGAAWVFDALSKTPFAVETRETLDTARTLEEALQAYVDGLEKRA